jgi:hypothetical protein
MRRMYAISALCLLLLFVPIYIWKIQGGIGSASDKKPERIDVSKELSTVTDPTVDVNSIEDLARRAPVELLRQSLQRYEQANVTSYSCTFVMHEQVNGKLKNPEIIECWFKESPYSVFMHWKQGAERAAASLYVQGENNNQVCIRPEPKALKWVGWATRDIEHKELRESARYLITEFGVRCGTERTYKAWKALHEQGATLNVEYLGKKSIEELGGRECHIIRRHCSSPEEEGMTNVTLYIDAETWFQTGSVLMAGDRLIGKYFFKDIVLNPRFDDKQFKPETLKKY